MWPCGAPRRWADPAAKFLMRPCTPRAVGRLRLESDLRAAMTEHQFRVFYQPVLHLATRRIVSFEALLRWDHPSQGLISPYRFIEAAEDYRNSGVDRTLVDVAGMPAIARVGDDALIPSSPVSITVNVSARQFADARLVSDIQNALQETGVDPSRLQLEMTESVAAADPKLTVTRALSLEASGNRSDSR